MSWQPINFQSFLTLNRPFVDQLNAYLEEKEVQLASSLLKIFIDSSQGSFSSQANSNEKLRLSDAVEEISRKIRQEVENRSSKENPKDWKEVVTQCNQLFWDHVETLISCSQEFFYQISQIGLDQWHEDFLELVQEVKDLIMHRIEDTLWTIKRIEEKLWDYRTLREHDSGIILKMKRSWTSLLDRDLTAHLKKCEEYLRKQYAAFSEKYTEFLKIETKVGSVQQKFRMYPIFQTMERGSQDKFIHIYHLLKLWEYNLKSKSIAEIDFVKAVYAVASVEKTIHLLKEYYQLLKQGLFEKSKAIKMTPEELFLDNAVRSLIYETLMTYQAETHTLALTVHNFREFILRTDPNPYVRSRWGFAKSIVGPEPENSKQLHNLQYDIEALNKLYESLCQAFQKGPVSHDQIRVSTQDDREIQHALHEMGQPLVSHHLMKSRIEYILIKISALNELGTYGMEITDYVRSVLSKILRLDWKYNTFNEIQQFKVIYDVHKGIMGPTRDRTHLGRLHKFQVLIADIKNKISTFKKSHGKHSVESVEHEIESDIHDIKSYLQDFLAYLQRVWSDKNIQNIQLKEIVTNSYEQLLEYRYIFGKFFWQLSKSQPDGIQFRNQFLFVDQYFETIEQKIQELKVQMLATNANQTNQNNQSAPPQTNEEVE